MKLTKSMYSQYQASLFGACFLSFGLGGLFGSYFNEYVMYLLIIIGVILHGWGMYNMYRHKGK